MKRITNLLSLITSIFIISACSTAYPDMIDSITVYNLNYYCGSYLSWNKIDNASLYNIYSVSGDNDVKKLTSTTKTTAFVEPGSTQIAISAEIDGKETYLSELKKGENTWWTKVTCNKQDSGYSLSWKTLPIAEDYVLVSSYSVTYVMNKYASGKSELKLKELTDYEHEAASPNPYNAKYNYRKCRSLNTTENNIVYTGTDFNSGMYSYYVTLFAKVGDNYYQISDKFVMK